MHKNSQKLGPKNFYSKGFQQILIPCEILQKTLPLSEEVRFYYDLYQPLLFHFQEKQTSFFDLIEVNLKRVSCHIQNFFEIQYYVINP